MPLRDHFRTKSTPMNWEALHGGWPMMIAQRLNSLLPEQYIAQPKVRLGSVMEVDIGTLERENNGWKPEFPSSGNGVTVAWSPAAPTVLLETELADPSIYEVNIYTQDEYRLVACIELISPSNKDRADNRQNFIQKCKALLRQNICVILVDVVTNRNFNLYAELQEGFHAGPTEVSKAALYAVSCRGTRKGNLWKLEAYEHSLSIGSPLPTLPLWLDDENYVALELESTYEEACSSLRIR